MPTLPADRQIRDRRILIVDDEPRNVLLLTRTLESAGFAEPVSTTNSADVLPICRQSPPDLVLLDLHMPEPDGFQILHELRHLQPPGSYLPVLVLTADPDERVKRRALAAGATDFLTKPFSLTEVLLRIRNLLETRELHATLAAQNLDLAARVAEKTRQLESARLEVLERLSQAVEWRDDITGRHTRRVGEAAAALAEAIGLASDDVDLIRRAAPLHDVGKVAVPDAVLHKPGRLTDEEFRLMQQHTVVGARILSRGNTALMIAAESIAHSHHERWDGTGYPSGASGDEIPLFARIVSVVDVYDALTHARQYRGAWPAERATELLRTGMGTAFDPRLVEAFLDAVEPGVHETTGGEGE